MTNRGLLAPKNGIEDPFQICLVPAVGNLQDHVVQKSGNRRVGWATRYIEGLAAGETVQFRPRGHSMSGKIESGQLCTVEPVDVETLDVGDIVLCKVNGTQYLHLIKAIQGQRFQIGNNRGRINGWITANQVFGKCVRVEP